MLKINEESISLVNKCESELKSIFEELDKKELINSKKVLDAFHKNNLNESDLYGTYGYGYNDIGRDKIESIYSDIFGSEDSLVRREFVSGSHALSISLSSLLRPGDVFLSISGEPYDTMHEVIGIKENDSSLKSYGVSYREIDLVDNDFDYDRIKNSLNGIKLVYIQRSRGYSLRESLSINKLEKVIKLIKSINKDIIVFVDNCYCEFVEDKTPIQVGADIIVGSLIKNLGAGICTHGAYVTGKKDLIKLVSERLYLAGEGKDVGPSIESNRMFLMGLYMSPSVVNSSLKSSILISKVMDRLNFNVSPKWNQERCDIVEILYLENEENLINFATSIQESGPVNSGVLPTPGEMPGYSDKVIMASPSFTQGSSIEMSCDAPLRKPYALYIQGGLTYSYAKLALMNAVSNLKTRE